MTPFSAVLVRRPDHDPCWTPAHLGADAAGALRPGDGDGGDVDVDADALADVVADAAAAADVTGPAVLVVLEREDEWFVLAREVAGDLAVFVSDADAAAAACPALVAGVEPAPVPAAAPDAEGRAGAPGPSWAGRADLLVDLGIGPEDLVAVAEGHDTSQALAVLGERAGFGDALEALR